MKVICQYASRFCHSLLGSWELIDVWCFLLLVHNRRRSICSPLSLGVSNFTNDSCCVMLNLSNLKICVSFSCSVSGLGCGTSLLLDRLQPICENTSLIAHSSSSTFKCYVYCSCKAPLCSCNCLMHTMFFVPLPSFFAWSHGGTGEKHDVSMMIPCYCRFDQSVRVSAY